MIVLNLLEGYLVTVLYLLSDCLVIVRDLSDNCLKFVWSSVIYQVHSKKSLEVMRGNLPLNAITEITTSQIIPLK